MKRGFQLPRVSTIIITSKRKKRVVIIKITAPLTRKGLRPGTLEFNETWFM